MNNVDDFVSIRGNVYSGVSIDSQAALLFDGELSDDLASDGDVEGLAMQDDDDWESPGIQVSGVPSFEFRWKGPGRLFIRHLAVRDHPYPAPIKHEGALPMPTPAVVRPLLKFSLDLKEYQRLRNIIQQTQDVPTSGNRQRRGGKKRRERMQAYRDAEPDSRMAEGAGNTQSVIAVERGSGVWTGNVLFNNTRTPLDSRSWQNRVIHTPDDQESLRPSAFMYYNKIPNQVEVGLTAEAEMALRPPRRVPEDGWWVLPVDPSFEPELWARKGSKAVTELESWGLSYFALRSPRGFIGSRLIRRLLAAIQPAYDGDGVSHPGIVGYMRSANRSAHAAGHLGLTCHYGGDKVGPSGLHLTRDTTGQNGDSQLENARTDAIKRLLDIVQCDLAPIITRYMWFIDPDVYQFHQMVRQRVLAFQGSNMKDWPIDFGGVFYCVAISKGHSARIHTRATDHIKSYTLIVPFGEFDGGDVVLASRGLSIPVKSGQFLAVAASFLPYFVAHTTGLRYALTLFTDKFIATKTRDVMLQMGLAVSDLNFEA